MKTMTEKKIFVPSFDNIAFTENGAVSYKTTGVAIADQFGKAGNYRGRDLNAVFKEQEALWLENHENAVRFPFYLRLVTRKVKVNGENVTDKVQKGQGVRDESFKRLLSARYILQEHMGIASSWFLEGRVDSFVLRYYRRSQRHRPHYYI